MDRLDAETELGYEVSDACRNGDLERLDRVLQLGIDIQMPIVISYYSIYEAFRGNHLGVINRLFERDEFRDNVFLELELSSRSGLLDRVLNLVERINNNNVEVPVDSVIRAVQSASANGHLEVVRILLQFQEAVDNITNDENQALRIAHRRDHQNVFKLLMEIPSVEAYEINNDGPHMAEATFRANCRGKKPAYFNK